MELLRKQWQSGMEMLASSPLVNPYVIKCVDATGENGHAPLYFFPVDNQLSINDPKLRQLLLRDAKSKMMKALQSSFI